MEILLKRPICDYSAFIYRGHFLRETRCIRAEYDFLSRPLCFQAYFPPRILKLAAAISKWHQPFFLCRVKMTAL